MFRKVILVIVLILVVTGSAIYMNTRKSNDENSVAMYGRFTDDHYISDYLGIDVDMSENWVYFTEKTLRSVSAEYADEYGINLSDLMNEEFFLTMLKPGLGVIFTDNGKRYDPNDLTEKTINETAAFFGAMLEETGRTVELKGSGVMEGNTEIGYFSFRMTGRGQDPQICTIALFNTDKTGIFVIGVSYETVDNKVLYDLLKNKVKILYYDDIAEAA